MNPYVSGAYALAQPNAAVEVIEESPDEMGQKVVADLSVPQQMHSTENPDGSRTVYGGGQPLSVLVPFRPQGVLKSELPGVSDQAWTDFVYAMKTAPLGAISESGGLGMFEMKVRRLGDLGVMKDVGAKKLPSGKLVWVGEWIPPITQAAFLASPKMQYRAFSKSMQLYKKGIESGELLPEGGDLPSGMTLSGALAALQRRGPLGVRRWQESAQFPSTEELYQRANGIF